MYAIFKAQGMQFRAEPEATIRIPSLRAAPGDTVKFDEVLMTSREGDVRVGTPALGGASVAAEVVRHGRGEKIIVYKMKRRKGYRRKQGHRQGFTEIRIVEIDFPSGKAAKGGARKTAKPDEPEAVAPVETEEAPPPVVDEAAASDEADAAAAEPEPEATDDVDITDVARAMAEEAGLDVATIEGTGKGGRILKSDVDKAIKARDEG